MKSLLRYICVLLIFFAFEFANASGSSKNLGLDLGLGFNSTYGLLGLGGRYFVSENQDININMAGDVSGFIIGAGSRFYFQSSEDKCFFVFSCKPKYFVGVTAIRANGSTVTIEGDGAKGEYKQSDGYAGQLTVGSYDIFDESFTMGFELGYRTWLKRPDFKFQSGTFLPKHQSDLEKYVEDSIGVGLTLGWIF